MSEEDGKRAVHTPSRNMLGGVDRERMMCGEDFDRIVANGETYSLHEGKVTCPRCLDAIANDRRPLHQIPTSRREWTR